MGLCRKHQLRHSPISDETDVKKYCFPENSKEPNNIQVHVLSK